MATKNPIVDRALEALRALGRDRQTKAEEVAPEEPRPPATNLDSLRWWEPGAVCWHCSGSGACRCLCCDISWDLACPTEVVAGPCIICKGAGRLPEQIQ
jgi:hypothetical protein